jgi:hypothetical protein
MRPLVVILGMVRRIIEGAVSHHDSRGIKHSDPSTNEPTPGAAPGDTTWIPDT